MAQAARRIFGSIAKRRSAKPVRQVRPVPPGRVDVGAQVLTGIGLGIGFFVGQTLMQLAVLTIVGWLQ